MLNANCMLYLLVSYSRIPIVIYNVVIKNENYLFLCFYLPLLDCNDCRSFEFNLNFWAYSFLGLKKNSNKIAEIIILPPIITLVGGISFIKSQAHSGPKTASVSIKIPTTAAGVVRDPMVIIINPKPI